MPLLPLVVLLIFLVFWTHETLYKSHQTVSKQPPPPAAKASSQKLAKALKEYLEDQDKPGGVTSG
jgi:hypothetical protein